MDELLALDDDAVLPEPPLDPDGLALAAVAARGELPLGTSGLFSLVGEAGNLQALADGPWTPYNGLSGAPPGSGTQALGFDGSGSLTPGWLGPYQA